MKLKITAILLYFILFQACSETPPEFDGQSAFNHIEKQCDFGPRNPGSLGHEKCLKYLSDELSKYADVVRLQPFTIEDPYNPGDTLFLTNIISSFNVNPKSGHRILLGAHWDTRPRADKDPDPDKQDLPILGANDGAGGTALLLEVAKNLKMKAPEIGVDIILFDGEDYGKEGDDENYCLGAREFMRQKGNYQPVYGIIVDFVADKNLDIPKESYSLQYARSIVEKVWGKAKKYGITEFRDEVKYTILDDHLILSQYGIPSIDIIDFDYPHWHTHEDTPDKCSPESLEKVGKVILGVIYNEK